MNLDPQPQSLLIITNTVNVFKIGSSITRVLFASANIHVSIRIGTILCRKPAGIPVITGDFCDIVAQNHHIVAI